MFKVGICDSSAEFRKFISGIIWNLFYMKSDIKIYEYKNGSEFINSLSTGGEMLDLLILELELPDMNGLGIADIIKRNSIRTDIIVLTMTDKYVFSGYRYNLFDYVIKTSDMCAFKSSLKRYSQEHIDSSTEYFCIKTRGCVQHIKLDKIAYFENRGRKMAAVSEDEEFEFYLKMDELLSTLPQDIFVRCHQSYVVNIRNIQSFTHSSIVMRNNLDIPVSRKYYPSLKQVVNDMLIIT